MLPYLSLAADLLIVAASGAAAVYCWVLSRRLSRLTRFDSGIGGAIAVLSAQVDEMKAALTEARAGTEGAGHQLQDLVRQAREIAGELELMIASCHDFAEQAIVVQGAAPPPAPPPAVEMERPAAPPGAAPEPAAPVPIFGSRRAAPAEPVFRRHAQV
jgi:hypothetical protein